MIWEFNYVVIVADNPDILPRKDYDDYTHYINDAFSEEKKTLLSKV